MKDELLALVAPYGQEHLLAFWDELPPAERSILAAEIRDIDFGRLERLGHSTSGACDWAARAGRAEAPPAVRRDGRGSRFSPAQARRRPEQALSAGRLGVVLVAGGQGTRLGFDHPKGMLRIGPVSGATLFQILIEKLLAVSRRYAARIPLYLMTSPATHDETIGFLDRHQRFGLPAEDLWVFCQGTMPAVDASSGRVLLAEPGRISQSPDGHGGMLAALARTGALADIHRRGVEQLFYMQVDNPLVVVCDPEFIGYHLLSGSELSTQVIAKETPLDRVGNVVSIDGKVEIIEYTDLPDEAARQRLPDGSLKLWAGSTAIHVFDVALLDRMSRAGQGLPYHLVRKRVPYIDAGGRRVEPEVANAIKFEQFIFDLLPAAERAIVVEVDAPRAFAPVKNAPGADCDTPESVQAQMVALATEWLARAGAAVEPGVATEISPLFALDSQELRQKIQPTLRVSKATYFR